jgi:hypothetical protein
MFPLTSGEGRLGEPAAGFSNEERYFEDSVSWVRDRLVRSYNVVGEIVSICYVWLKTGLGLTCGFVFSSFSLLAIPFGGFKGESWLLGDRRILMDASCPGRRLWAIHTEHLLHRVQ